MQQMMERIYGFMSLAVVTKVSLPAKYSRQQLERACPACIEDVGFIPKNIYKTLELVCPSSSLDFVDLDVLTVRWIIDILTKCGFYLAVQ
jgi:hypothetical protein